MGGVRDDQVCFRHFCHHSPPRQSPLKRTNPGFDMRVAFGLLVLFFDFLLGHHLIFLELPLLIVVIENTKRKHEDAGIYQDFDRHPASNPGDVNKLHLNQREEELTLLLNDEVDNVANDDKFENGLSELNQRAEREEITHALQWAQSRETGLDCLPGQHKFYLGQVCRYCQDGDRG